MEKEYILGLDVSTSTVGISLFNLDGKLLELNHVSPAIKDENILKHDLLWVKSQLVINFLVENYPATKISEIILETPLISSQQKDTASLLNYFGGIFFGQLRANYGDDTKIDYITVDEARRFGLPEILGGKNKTLFGAFNTLLDKSVMKECKKMIVLSLIAQRYPSIVWLLNNNLTIDKKNLDRADAITVVLGYKQKNKIWIPNQQDIELTKDFIERNIQYEKFIKTLDKSTKAEKDKEKYNYLKNIFQIEKYLNVAI